jgi:hypothetical protein
MRDIPRGIMAALACAVFVGGCGGGGTTPGDDDVPPDAPTVCIGVDCSGHGECFAADGEAICQCDGGYIRTDPTTCEVAAGPTLGGCPLFPVDYIFNTPIDALPVHPDSADFIDSIGGGTRVHLDLGTTVDQQSDEYYGIPYNIVHGASMPWREVEFRGVDMDWNPRPESDCAVGPNHDVVSPCTPANAPNPLLPIPDDVLVEGGINSDLDQQPYGDHHILLLDADACRLWEVFHAYMPAPFEWDIFGSATWDLTSNALRPDGWTSADAAGFPILPLVLRADEAATGEIKHALRFTIGTIRGEYVWPARHLNSDETSSSLPAMGQLFRLKASYAIPAGASTQSRAILQAMKTYGMYLADGGSDMYVQGEPSADWDEDIFDTVQSVTADDFEAVDLSPIMGRDGFDSSSGRVP